VSDLRPANGTTGTVVTIDGRAIARTVFVVCVAFEATLVLLDYHVNYGRLTEIGALRRLTNIAREDSLASWFGTSQTLLIGVTAWAYWVVAGARHEVLWRRVGWVVVACFFTYMAVDDGVQLHERFGTAYSALSADSAARFPSFAWQLLFVPVLGVSGAAAVAFLWYELHARWARYFVAGAFVLLVIAVGLDFIEGLAPDHRWNVYAAFVARYDFAEFTEARFRQAPFNALLHFSRSLEEFLEMLANTCIWTAMLSQIGAVMSNLRIHSIS
jgi:hypothetical protein